MSKKNIIVIAPHADDEIIGCGGTIAKHIYNKDIVTIIICTNANIGAPEIFSKKYIQNVRKEALLSHKVLGKLNTIFLDFPAPILDIFPKYLISNKISEIFKKIKPEIVYIPFPGDLHHDHKSIYYASLVSCRTTHSSYINQVLSYEVLSETECSSNLDNINFKPNLFIDVNKFMNKKINAMKKYKSQLKKYPNSRSIEAIQSLAISRGTSVNLKKAEAFCVERILQK